MTARVVLLRTQSDIIDFRLGHRPADILVRDFATTAEQGAYEDGIDAVADQYDRVEGLTVAGATVTYTRRSEDPEAETVTTAVQVKFGTAAEAEAYRQGLQDAEGYAAPLLIDDTDDRFEQLLAWSGADGCTV
ncbi:MAG: hypothetical protein ACM3VY_00315 [Candidatus Bathyarchaeota archaeon]